MRNCSTKVLRERKRKKVLKNVYILKSRVQNLEGVESEQSSPFPRGSQNSQRQRNITQGEGKFPLPSPMEIMKTVKNTRMERGTRLQGGE